jgi:hypothetical protein
MPVNFQNTISDELATSINLAVQNVASRIQWVTTAVSSAEVLALNATPKTLVAAPGAGLVLEFVSAIFILDFNSAAYATNGILSVRETNAAGQALSVVALLAPFLAQTADTILPVQALDTGLALTANTPMVLSVATGETITGDSPLSIRTAYRVHTTGL